ncbi:PqqD family protein [bacterium]|nr:PqqD family protein [bacterium]
MPFSLSRKKAPSFSKKEALNTLPIRNPYIEWETTEDGEVILKVPRRKDWLGKFLAFVFAPPEVRQISLDKIGSEVWNLSDGQHTFDDIVRIVSKNYKLTRREAEVGVAAFLRELGKRKLIVLAVRKEEEKNEAKR